MKKSILAAWVVLLMGFAGAAGTAVAQTPMAFRNLGQRISPDDARMVGRGGWGMAVADTTHPGFKNVASVAFLRHVVLKYTGYGELGDASGAQTSRQTSGVYSPGIQVAAPVIKDRLGLTAGFRMHRSTRWEAQLDSTWALAGAGGVAMAREGTRFKVPLGAGWRLTDALSISAAVNLESGSAREEFTEAFQTVGVGANVKESKDLYRGTSQTFGLLFRPSERLSLGAAWTPGYDLQVDREVKAAGVTARYRTTFDLHLPDEYLAGFQFRFTDRWQVGSDLQYMPFTKFSGDDTWASEMYDEYTVGFGFERRKASVRRAGMSNLPLRMGYNRHRWAYGLGGEAIDEHTYSVGTGFGFAGDQGQLDVSVSYGVIGDLDRNGVQSDVWRLGISVTGLEAWW
jgi:long-subunit fatty acid transport protein